MSSLSFRLSPALTFAVAGHLHLEPGECAASTVGRRRVGDKTLVAALKHLLSRLEAIVGELSSLQEDVLVVEDLF